MAFYQMIGRPNFPCQRELEGLKFIKIRDKTHSRIKDLSVPYFLYLLAWQMLEVHALKNGCNLYIWLALVAEISLQQR